MASSFTETQTTSNNVPLTLPASAFALSDAANFASPEDLALRAGLRPDEFGNIGRVADIRPAVIRFQQPPPVQPYSFIRRKTKALNERQLLEQITNLKLAVGTAEADKAREDKNRRWVKRWSDLNKIASTPNDQPPFKISLN